MKDCSVLWRIGVLGAGALAVLSLAPNWSNATPDTSVVRIASPARIETAVALALGAFAPPDGPGAEVAVLVRADDAADALSAAGLTGALDAPVLLTDGDNVSDAVLNALDELGARKVIVLGGESAVGPGVAAALEEHYDVERIAGQDRFDTAAASARAAVGAGARTDRAIIASGEGFADAVAVAPLAYAGKTPLLLTAQDGLPPAITTWLDDHRPGEVLIVGGHAAVGPRVDEQLEALGITARRVAGATRQETATRVADVWPQWGEVHGRRVLLARSDGFADALAAGPYAGRHRAPLLLTDTVARLGPSARSWLRHRCAEGRTVQVVGGTAAVADSVVDAALRASRVCTTGQEVVFGFAAHVADEVDAPGFADEVGQILADPHGWSVPGQLRFAPADADADAVLVVRLVDDPGHHVPGCTGAVACRAGRLLLVAAQAWSQPPVAGWKPEDYRRWLVHHLVGHWLGQEHRPCADSGIAAVMRPDPASDGSCHPGLAPLPVERDEVLDRYLPRVEVAMAGDVHGEGVVARQLANGANPLHAVADTLSAADLAVVNLETAVGHGGQPAGKEFTFQAPVTLVRALADAGVDIVSLANNHALDYGTQGLLDTIAHARAAGLSVVGAGRDASEAYAPVLVQVNGLRVAVVGLSRVLPPGWAAGSGRPGLASAYDEQAAVAAVRAANSVADHVVVMIHWGVERADCPDSHQRRLAGLLASAGADVIAGHHPHVLQGIARHESALVAYSLGNFVWYHNQAPSRYTGVLTATLGVGPPNWRFLPAEIDGAGSPIPATPELEALIRGRIDERSPGGGRCSF